MSDVAGPVGDGPLGRLWEQLGPDEKRVVVAVAERLVLGREQYGALDLATDERDMRAEAAEEFLDGAIYLAMRSLQPARLSPAEAECYHLVEDLGDASYEELRERYPGVVSLRHLRDLVARLKRRGLVELSPDPDDANGRMRVRPRARRR